MKLDDVALVILASAVFNLKYFIKCNVGICGGW
jgi:hypothetical protein